MASQRTPAGAAEVRPAPAVRDPGWAPLVLVVEDDPDVRTLASDVLTDAGFLVATASGGAEALRLAAARTPDVVVLDFLLPDTTGWEIAPRFTAQAGRRVPVIAATGVPASQFRLPPDVLCVVAKPYQAGALVAAVRGALGALGERDAGFDSTSRMAA